MATETTPREGMMALVRNRRALVTAVRPFDGDEAGRTHVVEVEYADGIGAETDELLWEVEASLGAEVLAPSRLPRVLDAEPMPDTREFDALVRAARWSALTPSLPFSGLAADRPPVAAPLFGAVHPEAYQLVPVLRALESPRVALLLADAVGLGKTIQAGMIIRELMLRRRVRRVLVLSPASLRTQWRDELAEKFSLPFEVVDRPQTLKLQRELGLDANPWRVHERIVASYHYLKQPDVLEQLRAVAAPGDDGRLRWDLLVVDEAHNLAPSSFGDDSDLSRMLQRIAPWFEHRLFLTATPHNGHTRSFSGLLEILDPVRFTRKSALDEEDRARVGEAVVRRLKSEINEAHVALGEPPRFSERFVDALPPLRFGAPERALSEAFHDFRKALRKATAKADPTERTAGRFASEVLQKRLLSGPWAFAQSWHALQEGLAATASAATVARIEAVGEEDTDDDTERESRQRQADRTVGAWLATHRGTLAGEIAAVTEAVRVLGVERVTPGLDPAAHRAEVARVAGKVRADARLKALEALVDEHLRAGDTWRADERLVVFTEYLATLDYLVARLRAKYGEGDWLLSLYGGLDDASRDEVKRRFNDPHGPARILVATDAAGEGLNLQRSARLLLHWDIPWNPGKMEQRNGRLDRHGQARDVLVRHFDSTDDASMRFLGKVLKKRSQTREDRVVTDDIFARALLAHFEQDEGLEDAESRLEQTIARTKQAQGDVDEELPDAPSLPGREDRERLERLKEELDLSPATLRETLETCLAIDAGRPRLTSDGAGRDRFTPPLPGPWRPVVRSSLAIGGPEGEIPALVFDPEHYIIEVGDEKRPVFLPESDSRLVHLGHALSHRVISTFARFRYPGAPKAATRWIARSGEVPAGADALVLLTVEELAVNELREPCHQWVRTVALPVRNGVLGAPLPEKPAAAWACDGAPADVARARAIWEDVEEAVEGVVVTLAESRTAALRERLAASGKAVEDAEKVRFAKRRKELEKAMRDTQIGQLEKEAEKLRKRSAQLSFDRTDDDALARAIGDIQAEIALRQRHYRTVLDRLTEEETRTLERILPPRYTLRGEARVFPVAVEIRMGGAR